MEPLDVEQPTLALSDARVSASAHSRLHNWRWCEALSALFAFIGWVAATVDYEIRFSHLRSNENCAQIDAGNTLRWFDASLTLCAIVFLIQRHRVKVQWKKQTTVWGAWIRLGGEIGVMSLFPYPYVEGKVYVDERHLRPSSPYRVEAQDVCYTGSEILYALMFLRFFFIFRALANTYPYMDSHAKRVCKQHGVKANMRFTLRAMAESQPLWLFALLLLPIAFLSAQLIRVFERPYVVICKQDLSAYSNAVYLAFIAMTTIAYGDYYPCTELGRFVNVLIDVWGMGTFSMLIYCFDRSFHASKPQEKAFRSLRRTRTAARLIESWYLFKRRHQHSLRYKAKFESELVRFRLKLRELHTVRSLKAGHRKEMHILLDELEEALTRIETRASRVDVLSSRVQYIAVQLETLDKLAA